MNLDMKKRSFLLKSLIGLFVGFTMVGCEGKSDDVLSFHQVPVSKFSRDSVVTVMTYADDATDGDKYVDEYSFFVRDSLISKSDVRYTSTGIVCVFDSVSYSIELERGIHAVSVEAQVNGGLWYRVAYTYNSQGYIEMAALELPEVYKTPVYILYTYEESSISINEWGDMYELALSSNENTGNVCSVLSYSDAPLTTKYVINPDLYFLNIYGAPIPNLPSGQTIKRQNNQLTRVGKFYYEY